MKRIVTTALAALMVAGPMSVSAASAHAYDRRGEDRSDRRDDDRRDGRWDQRRHNGYYSNGRWSYGRPSAAIAARRDFRPGYQQWRRGDRLPASYRSHYHVVDWRREHLRAPPRGYHYVRTDRGETLLVGIATGVILGLILGAN
jgi:Ni/Co efflux regulator RcnB